MEMFLKDIAFYFYKQRLRREASAVNKKSPPHRGGGEGFGKGRNVSFD